MTTEVTDKRQMLVMMKIFLQQQEALAQKLTENKEEILRQLVRDEEEGLQWYEEILRQQVKDKEDILQWQVQDKQDILQRFDSLGSRLDNLEKQSAQDKETTQTQYATIQKLLQTQGKQCEAMQTNLQ